MGPQGVSYMVISHGDPRGIWLYMAIWIYMAIWLYGIWYMVYGIGIWYMVYGIWYMACGIWYMVCGIWYMVGSYTGSIQDPYSMPYRSI